MSERLIFGSDFDGTYRTEAAVLPRDLKAASEFRRRGNLFGIVTGRNVCEAKRRVVSMLEGEFDFLLCSNGAVCIMPDGKILFSDLAPAERILDLYDTVVRLSGGRVFVDVTGCGSGICPGTGDSGGISALENMHAGGADADAGEFSGDADVMEYTDGGPACVKVRREFLGNVKLFTQFSALFPRDAAVGAAEEINREFAGLYEAHVAHTCVDITASGVNKASGLLKYAKTVGVPRENIFTAGDSRNDLQMLRAFNGLAMEGSDDVVLDSALAVVGHVAEALSLAESGSVRRA